MRALTQRACVQACNHAILWNGFARAVTFLRHRISVGSDIPITSELRTGLLLDHPAGQLRQLIAITQSALVKPDDGLGQSRFVVFPAFLCKHDCGMREAVAEFLNFFRGIDLAAYTEQWHLILPTSYGKSFHNGIALRSLILRQGMAKIKSKQFTLWRSRSELAPAFGGNLVSGDYCRNNPRRPG
ncbi:hypothetical protein [Brucella pituitosa]|uniref:hypothetical protein n=1 Tax=Brucella pituitosa TaxID=571256 RepID=UPI0013747209|nr:hypothetical protein [Brucella pituitosa]